MKKSSKKIVPKLDFLYDEARNKVGVSIPRKVYEEIIEAVNDYRDYKDVLKDRRKKS